MKLPRAPTDQYRLGKGRLADVEVTPHLGSTLARASEPEESSPVTPKSGIKKKNSWSLTRARSDSSAEDTAASLDPEKNVREKIATYMAERQESDAQFYASVVRFGAQCFTIGVLFQLLGLLVYQPSGRYSFSGQYYVSLSPPPPHTHAPYTAIYFLVALCSTWLIIDYCCYDDFVVRSWGIPSRCWVTLVFSQGCGQ
jgi:hypothetical protein